MLDQHSRLHPRLQCRHALGKQLSRCSTDASNFMRMVVLGLAWPLTATKCADTLAPRARARRHARRRPRQGGRPGARAAHLAGKPAPSRTPLTMPATNAAGVKVPRSLGTDTYLVTNRS